jgi:hypothetical protein
MYAPRHYCGYQVVFGTSTGQIPEPARLTPSSAVGPAARRTVEACGWSCAYPCGREPLGEFEHFHFPLRIVFFCRATLAPLFVATLEYIPEK